MTTTTTDTDTDTGVRAITCPASFGVAFISALAAGVIYATACPRRRWQLFWVSTLGTLAAIGGYSLIAGRERR